MSEFGRREIATIGLAIVIGAAATACKGGSEKAGTAERRTASSPSPVWLIPPSIEEKPQMTEEDCKANWWNDVDGQRRPLADDTPPQLTIDGRCNTPLSDTGAGIYDKPQKAGRAAIVAHNGDKFNIDCWTFGEPVKDARGPISDSDVWARITKGGWKSYRYVSETDVGYIDEREFKQCGEDADPRNENPASVVFAALSRLRYNNSYGEQAPSRQDQVRAEPISSS